MTLPRIARSVGKTSLHKHAKIAARRRRWAVETLEARQLLAGDVSVHFQGGDLTIDADGDFNGIQIEGSTTQYGEVYVRGVDHGYLSDSPTIVDGVANQTVTLNTNGSSFRGGAIQGDLVVELGDNQFGNGKLLIKNLAISGDLIIRAGIHDAGSIIELENLQVSGRTKLEQISGALWVDASVRVVDSAFFGHFEMDYINGKAPRALLPSTVYFAGNHFYEDVDFRMERLDHLTLQDSEFDKTTDIRIERGEQQIVIWESQFADDAKVKTGWGDDFVTIISSDFFENLEVDMGDGADIGGSFNRIRSYGSTFVEDATFRGGNITGEFYNAGANTFLEDLHLDNMREIVEQFSSSQVQELTSDIQGQSFDVNYLDGPRTHNTFGPRVLSVTPEIDHLRIRFTESIDPATVGTEDVKIFDRHGFPLPVQAITPVAGDDTAWDVTFQPASDGGYRMEVGPNVADTAGNLMNLDIDFNKGEPDDDVFVLEDFDGPAVVGHEHSPGNIRVWFDEPLSEDGFFEKHVTLTDPWGGYNTQVEVTPVPGSGRMAFDLKFDKFPPGGYALVINANTKDAFGNKMDADGDSIGGEFPDDQYAPLPYVDQQSPNVLGWALAQSGPIGPLGTQTFAGEYVMIAFSEPMEPGTFDPAAITITRPDGTIVHPYVVQPYDGGGLTSQSLPEYSQWLIGIDRLTWGTYQMQIASTVSDLFHNPLDGNADGVGGQADDAYEMQIELQPLAGRRQVGFVDELAAMFAALAERWTPPEAPIGPDPWTDVVTGKEALTNPFDEIEHCVAELAGQRTLQGAIDGIDDPPVAKPVLTTPGIMDRSKAATPDQLVANMADEANSWVARPAEFRSDNND